MSGQQLVGTKLSTMRYDAYWEGEDVIGFVLDEREGSSEGMNGHSAQVAIVQ